MTEFTAPQAGRYHFATGQEPHLEADCIETCPVGSSDRAEPGSVVTIEFAGDHGAGGVPSAV